MAWTTPRTWTDGEFVTAAIMNPHIRDNFNAVTRFVPKTADETVTSSTVLQDDNHLLFAMLANEVYGVEAVLWTSNAGGVGHFKYSFTVPASASYMMASMGLASGGTFSFDSIRSVSDTPGMFSASTGSMIFAAGVVANAGTAGNFTLQWAQNTSNGTGTVLKKGSYFLVSKLA